MFQTKRKMFTLKRSISLPKESRTDEPTASQVVTPDNTSLPGTPPNLPQELERREESEERVIPAPAPVKPTPADNMADEDILKQKHKERVLVVGKGVVLTANVTSCDKVIVEGHFQGTIKTGMFVLAQGGQMEGEVRCADGCIGGKMEATIVATNSLLIGKAAVVTGDMMYDTLQVKDGGRLQGKLTHFTPAPEKTETKPVSEAGA